MGEPTPEQIVKWCQKWWQNDDWRKEQMKVYACDVAHLLRGVADMIEQTDIKDKSNE